MKSSILIFSILLLATTAIAQNSGKVGGSVTGSNAKGAEGATISLLRAKDSAIARLSVAGKDGSFLFEKVAAGKYLVSASVVGYQKGFSAPFELTPQQQNIQLPAIALVASNKDLAGVTVAAKRPLVEQRIDRTIVNVDASITNIGTSALEVLEKSPGVSVDREGNISLKGKEGVLVMVDNRPTQLSGADLANLLRGMNSSQLDQIEIMTNPPARYDAAGTSGVINIKTKKTIMAGYNGTATIGISQGRYPKTNEGLNFNYREGKLNLYTNLSHNYQKGFGTVNIDRNIFNANTSAVENIFNQQANRISQGNSYNGKVGVDYFWTKKTTIGFAVGATSRHNESNNLNTTNISNASKALQSTTNAAVNNENDWSSFSTNVYFRSVLDKKGSEITADLDFQKYNSDESLFMVNSYRDAAGSEYRVADTLTGTLPQNINIYSGRMDFLKPLKKGAKFEAGIKSGLVETDNNAGYDSVLSGTTVRDLGRSNHFIYKENINAAYINLSGSLSKKVSAQLGLRLENTVSDGHSTGFKFNNNTDRFVPFDSTFKNNYTQLFPTAYLQYKLDDKNTFTTNIGRRVRRPNYGSLNPFIKFIDKYTYSQGNPNLKPSVSTTVEVAHSWKGQITTTLNYSVVNDLIESVVEQKGQEAYTKPANIASLRQFGISVNANNQVTKWWSSNISFLAFNNQTKGFVSNTDVNVSANSVIFSTTQQFKVTKTLTGEVNARFRTGWLEGVLRAKPIAFAGIGLSQQVLKNRGSVRFAVRDIFYSQRFRGRATYGNVDFSITQINESRVASLGFTYRFNKGKVAPVKRTAGSANEERERIDQ